MAIQETLAVIRQYEPILPNTIAQHTGKHISGVAKDIQKLKKRGKIKRGPDGWEIAEIVTLNSRSLMLYSDALKYSHNPLIDFLVKARHTTPDNVENYVKYVTETFPKEQMKEIITACQLVLETQIDYEGMPKTISGYDYTDSKVLQGAPNLELITIFKKTEV